MSPPATRPVLAVEGGGTGSRGVLLDPAARVVARAESGPANVVRGGGEPAVDSLEALIASLERETGTRRQTWTWGLAALAGARTRGEVETLTYLAHRVNLEPKRVTSDAVAAWAGAFGGEPGIVAIAGTGASVYGRTGDGRESLAGGLGAALGDPGSGFAVGSGALRLIGRRLAGLEADGPLAMHVLGSSCMMGATSEMVARLNKREWTTTSVAALAPAVEAAADAGDAAAAVLLAAAGHDLAALAIQVARELSLPGPVTLSGGLGLRSPRVRTAFFAGAAAGGLETRVSPLLSPLGGAALLALRQAGCPSAPQALREAGL